MNIVQAEDNLKDLVKKISKETFIFELMKAYDFPDATITRLKKGTLNKSKKENEIILKKKLYFIPTSKKSLDSVFEEAIKNNEISKQEPRFIIVTDYENLKAYDTKMGEKLETEIKNLSKHPDFFLPWAGIEKKVFQSENPADVKAAEKLAKVFDLIKLDNPKADEKSRHALNVFLTRILFCFFAEDTDIFENGLFTTSIASHTNDDGKDLNDYLSELFEVLNIDKKKRSKKIPDYLDKFPYVNGGLFAEDFPIPKFSKKSRTALIDLGDLNWAEINPDIFGSMLQAVVHPDQRAGLGMHYTSVTNIMKVIEPLFLSSLYEDFDKSKSSKSKLKKMLEKIGNIKIFDPACGSGNFLIIAYKELRLLEMKILKNLGEIPMSGISLSKFYGIEIDDFAHEVAKLSLWLAEHQMDVLFNREFGEVKVALPLKDSGKIICGNAARLDWINICPCQSNDEVYVLGNPPYLGAKELNEKQSEDMELVFKNMGNVLRLDYIACWFKKATDYIQNNNAKYAFVSTNSICQGEQVSLIWPFVFKMDQEIFFAHQSFNWGNNARDKAGVTCVITGIRNKNNEKKYIFNQSFNKQVKNISPYLIEGSSTYMEQRTDPLANLPKMILGSSGFDGGHLMISSTERQEFIKQSPESKKFIKKFTSGDDFINGKERYCMWINDSDLQEAMKISWIKERVKKCLEYRLSAGRDAKKAAEVPHRFFYRTHKDTDSIIFPKTTSGRRKYVPVGFSTKDTIVSNASFVIYDPEPYMLSLLSSRMHCVWMSVTSARMRNDYRYSVNLTYNTFPIPNLGDDFKKKLNELALKIIAIREKFTEKTLGELYDPEKMPTELLSAHSEIDSVIESLFQLEEFKSDEERLAKMFELYEQMSKK